MCDKANIGVTTLRRIRKGESTPRPATIGRIAKALGVEDVVTSPTFCLISEYEGKKFPLYHIDVYRLDGVEDFLNLGVEEMLYGKGVCVIEWCEKVRSCLPARTIFMTFSPQKDGSREIKVENWNNGTIE